MVFGLGTVPLHHSHWLDIIEIESDTI
jgi:hypothetical protein